VIAAITNAEAKYVAVAYGVVFIAVLVYVLIIALKLARLERELHELTQRLRQRQLAEAERPEQVPVG
jgi:CcmD family protein